MTYTLAWGNKVSPKFRTILLQGSREMRWDADGPNNLMGCMGWESAESFDPSIKNPLSSATGLIQFMDATAKALGTTTAKLAAMSPETQLRWVFKYFNQYPKIKGPGKKLSDYYMAILMPKFIGAAENAAVITLPRQYRVNKGLDLNKDGVITKAEAAECVRLKLVKGLKKPFVFIGDIE